MENINNFIIYTYENKKRLINKGGWINIELNKEKLDISNLCEINYEIFGEKKEFYKLLFRSSI